MHIQFAKASALCFLSALMLWAWPASAQSIWLGPGRPAGVALEVLRPDFEDGRGVTLLSSAVFLSGRYPLSDGADIVAEVPFSHFGADRGGSETALGNPYLGIELGRREDATYGEFGARLPVASENSGLVTGFRSDPDRWEAFFSDVLAVSGAVNYVYHEPSGFSLRLRGGPSVWVSTDALADDDVELLADYGAQSWYAAEQVRVGVGLTGRVIVTEGGLSLAERLMNQVGVVVVGRFEHVHPGLHARLPFDFDEDDFGEANYVLGLSIVVPLAP